VGSLSPLFLEGDPNATPGGFSLILLTSAVYAPGPGPSVNGLSLGFIPIEIPPALFGS
jgi:hypothetical protein